MFIWNQTLSNQTWIYQEKCRISNKVTYKINIINMSAIYHCVLCWWNLLIVTVLVRNAGGTPLGWHFVWESPQAFPWPDPMLRLDQPLLLLWLWDTLPQQEPSGNFSKTKVLGTQHAWGHTERSKAERKRECRSGILLLLGLRLGRLEFHKVTLNW